jgi:hypothetical protein
VSGALKSSVDTPAFKEGTERNREIVAFRRSNRTQGTRDELELVQWRNIATIRTEASID